MRGPLAMSGSVLIFAEFVICYAWVWPIRRRGGYDIPLDGPAKTARWVVFWFALALSVRFDGQGGQSFNGYLGLYLKIQEYPLAVLFRVIALASFVWPNTGFRVVQLLRWVRLIPPPDPTYWQLVKDAQGWS